MIIPYFYSAQIRKYLFAFADVFNGVQIAKYDQNGNISGYQTIPIIFPNQDKHFTYYNQQINGSTSTNPDVKIEVAQTLPSFSVKDLGFTLDIDRTRNKYDIVCEASKSSYLATPIRVNLNLKFNFEKLDECWQVIEQLLPLFNPVFSINVNPIDEHFANNLSTPIFIESTSNLFSSDLSEETQRIQQYTFSIRMDIWLFGKINNQTDITTKINFNSGV